ncbi:MAG: FtsQ-type POTRA domain-containing protein [Nitrospirae bacterium]|nr:FtsQ-type POTRA domain-containing protein [Nitrospirota bacterium]
MASKNNKRKSVSRRQGKLSIFLKKTGIILSVALAVTTIVLGTYLLAQAFYVREIEVSGNEHLDKRDIENILNIRRESLLDLHLKDIDERLRKNAWIKKTTLRWQLPGTLVIDIEEARPKALLNFEGETFLVNEEGNVMERLQDAGTPFLPEIKGIDPRYKKEMSEALKLVEALSSRKILADKQLVEIGLEPYGLNLNIDGEFIKVGYGQYAEKFDKWVELEPELKKMGVPIQYVDLRFKDSVIVKPVTPEKPDKNDKLKEKDKDKEKVTEAAKDKGKGKAKVRSSKKEKKV